MLKLNKKTKLIISRFMLTGIVLLSGCKNDTTNNIQKDTNEETSLITSTAIIFENNNMIIIDLQSYQKYINEIGASKFETIAKDGIWVLQTLSGDKILVDYDSVKIIEGENSHEIAEVIAESLSSEDSRITYYDDIITYKKIK